ncbi:hypothetical protein IHN63_11655 [Deinococcus sp. 6YEL10]|uniref:hypothetical protein n=1 Tax=Deinococcus sp. 6YEL10 TaxID=2745870 RepID=UPI001E41D398|nr:hypothetical protein [Deinococcus sp. 6YEL10]MCD0161960.1 hypothetical protein [Deinococcus sp. 6YEL10]
MASENVLVHIDRHAFRLSEVLYEVGSSGGSYFHDSSIGYLTIAYSIDEVMLTSHKFDDSVVYCGTAWDAAVGRSKRLQIVYTYITKFLYAFTAYEALVMEISERQISGSKTAYIRNKVYRSKIMPASHRESTEALICLLTDVFKNRIGDFEKYLTDSDEYKVNFLNRGILVISALRNNFVHGASFHESYATHGVDDLKMVQIMQLSRRIIFNTMQILIADHYSDTLDSKMHHFCSLIHADEHHPTLEQAVTDLALYNPIFHSDKPRISSEEIMSQIRKAAEY